jgi:AcrR family transcriptional regulator
MDGFEKRRNNKKEAILRAALELFGAFGFDKVTIIEIAEKARVSKVSIYNFFESKDNLRRVLIKSILDRTLEETRALVNKEGASVDKMREYLNNRIVNGTRYNMEFILKGIDSDLILGQYFEDFNTKNKRLIASLIHEGKTNGCFLPDVTDVAIEIYIDIFYTYFLSNRQVWRTLEHTPNLAEEINLLFMNGLTLSGSR